MIASNKLVCGYICTAHDDVDISTTYRMKIILYDWSIKLSYYYISIISILIILYVSKLF